jgi:hypothetical protein
LRFDGGPLRFFYSRRHNENRHPNEFDVVLMVSGPRGQVRMRLFYWSP